MDEEIWKPVVGYEGSYSVSSKGRVKSLARYDEYERCGKLVKRYRPEKILTPRINKGGYYKVHLRTGGQKHPTVHRLVCLSFISNPENKPTVNHKDGNKLNNNVDNLEWNTYSENTQHAYDNGLSKSKIYLYGKSGEDHPLSKLTVDKAGEIRKLREQGLTLSSLANKFNVSISSVHRVCTNQTWV